MLGGFGWTRIWAGTAALAAGGSDLQTAYPKILVIYHCELTPGQELALPSSLFDGRRAHAVFVYANLVDGERRARIDSWADGGAINFGRSSWSLVARDPKRSPPPRPPTMVCIA